MTWILWVIIAVLWTLLVGAAAYKAGLDEGRKTPVPTSEYDYDSSLALASSGPPGPVGATGPQGPPGPPGRDAADVTLRDIPVDDHFTFSEWKEHIEGRLTRAERRGGLSV